jgi:glycosyltransferase involved in cell wall biosynthesis
MLTTGTVADCIAVGVPALVSPWPYLAESLGDAGIAYGETADDLAACIDGLTADRLVAAAAACVARRAESDWDAIAESTLSFLDEVVTR